MTRDELSNYARSRYGAESKSLWKKLSSGFGPCSASIWNETRERADKTYRRFTYMGEQ